MKNRRTKPIAIIAFTRTSEPTHGATSRPMSSNRLPYDFGERNLP
jgi:hypothetical protein